MKPPAGPMPPGVSTGGSATSLLSTNAEILAVTPVSFLMKDAFCVTAEKEEGKLAVRKSCRGLRVPPGSAPLRIPSRSSERSGFHD